MGKDYEISLPDPRDPEAPYISYELYEKKEDAIKWAKHLFGADDNGNINIINEIDNGEEENNG